MQIPTDERMVILPESITRFFEQKTLPAFATRLIGNSSQSTTGGLRNYSHPDGTVSLPVNSDSIKLEDDQVAACKDGTFGRYGCVYLCNGACTAGPQLNAVQEVKIKPWFENIIRLTGNIARAFELAALVAQQKTPAFCDKTGHQIGILGNSDRITMQGGTVRINPPQ